MLRPTPLSDDEVAQIFNRCGCCYTAGSNFLKELSADPELRLTKPIFSVMVLLIRHQIEALDAATVLTKAGRPQFVSSISRSMYETYLNVLGVGFLRSTVGQVSYSPPYNARRFLAFRNVAVNKYDRKVELLSDAWARLGLDPDVARKNRRLLMRRTAAAKKMYGFNDKTVSWFHHNGVGGLFQQLWKDNSAPCFPQPLFPLARGRQEWLEWFGMYWGHGSNQVHASIVGLTSRPDDARGKWPSSDPVFEYSSLDSALSLADLSLYSAADALGKLAAFNRVSAATKLDASALRRYL